MAAAADKLLSVRVKVLMPYDDNVEVENKLRGVLFWAGLDSLHAEHGLVLLDTRILEN